jgi:hypothetical protein
MQMFRIDSKQAYLRSPRDENSRDDHGITKNAV